MKKGRFICYLLLAVAAVGLSRSTHTYLATCVACLQLARIVEKSILGITYSRTEELRPHAGTAYDSVTNRRIIAPLDPKLYREITGHHCEHTLVRDKFLRKYYFRKELVENLYRGYLRVPDQALARETSALIDQIYPSYLAKNPTAPRIRPPLQHSFEAALLPNEPLSILYRGLGLVSNSAEWRQVLDAARAGNGSLTLFVDPAILARRLDNPDPAVRFQIIDQLGLTTYPGWIHGPSWWRIPT
jgi:hypothetical protein